MRRLTLIAASALALGLPSAALANNDPLVPADNCSGNSNVVGQPDNFGGEFHATDVNATNILETLGHGDNKVDGAASLSNPGQSTGAKGEANSEAIAHCD
jgi:hypothetical protein